ncbi:hypothetical protein GCM10011511_55030 [Puia dinghuensis]|uniref:Uncharacterized protein n=2 Tax=Puia dinghuensis TaxID=1792502 RepID=A0A8J2UIU8_9BACT|nr:hypothetical protein GCM10011511_55030 [Puia dinghuensis]
MSNCNKNLYNSKKLIPIKLLFMNLEEIEALADLISQKVYQKVMTESESINEIKLHRLEKLDELAELIATKVNNKLEASGQLEINSTDLTAMVNLVSELQNKMEPDIIVKKIDL